MESERLKFHLTEAEYVEGQKVLRFVFTKSVCFRNLIALAAFGAAAGAYAYLHDGGSIAACVFWSASVYMLWVRLIEWRRRALRACRARPELLGPFEITIGAAGVSYKPESSGTAFRWSDISRYRETPDIFLILADTADLIILPKRVFFEGSASHAAHLLRAELEVNDRENQIVSLRKFEITAVAAGVLFAGFLVSSSGYVDIVLHSILAVLPHPMISGIDSIEEPEAAGLTDLHGHGEIFVAPLGKPQAALSAEMLDYYRNTFRLNIHVLDPAPIPSWAKDSMRNQWIAEELVEAMKRAYPVLANDPNKIVIGVTDEDMYISENDWDYAFNWRNEGRFVVISTARLSENMPLETLQTGRFEQRFRKLMTKNIGILYYHLQLSGDPDSVLYSSIGTTSDLDGVGEDYSQTDAATYSDVYVNDNDDPCITVRHYFAQDQAHADSAAFSGCDSFSARLGVETMEVDLRYGLFMDRRTEFYFPDRIPLQLTRVVRTQDSRSRAFGIGGSHSLNIFPVGNTWPFTWMDLLLVDGERIHYRRSNWGFAYWDARYAERGDSASEFSGSTVSWASPGWDITTVSGRVYQFPPGGGVQRPEQAALTGIQDQTGRLSLTRDSNGNLLLANSPSGFQLKFEYDDQNRITKVCASNGLQFDYQYDTGRHLSRVAGGGQVTEYRYEGDSALSIFHNGRMILHNDYDAGGRVIRLVLPDGHTYAFDYTFGSHDEITAVNLKDSARPPMRFRMLDRSHHTIEWR